MKNSIRNKSKAGALSGMTLIEVLVAMTILGVGLVAVMRAFSACTRTVGIVRGRTIARDFAGRVMSEARRNPSLLISEDEGNVGGQFPGFTWKRELRDTIEPGLISIRITVNWRIQGLRRDFSLVSLIEAPDLEQRE